MTPGLVAIPTYHLPRGRVVRWTTGGYGLPERYVSALCRASLSPVLLPCREPDDAEAILAPFDGPLLAGGGDVDPSSYGAKPHPLTYGVDSVRDAMELQLVSAATRVRLPTLAICRGMQVVNVAFHGTLHQHLPDVEGRDVHGDPTEGRSILHSVDVTPGSRLASSVQRRRLEGCASHHHQAVDRIGAGLVPVAHSDDGLVEGLELPPDGGWLVAVQWHPEANAAQEADQQALFDSFACQVRETGGRP